MRIFADLDSQKIVDGIGSNNPTVGLTFKRGSTAVLDIQFIQAAQVVELSSDATGTFGVKSTNQFDATPLVEVSSWTKIGTGTSTIYRFVFSFVSTALDALFFVDGNPANDVASIQLMAELEWLVAATVAKSQTITLTVLNNVIRGGETLP
jgi:hypothetical protein